MTVYLCVLTGRTETLSKLSVWYKTRISSSAESVLRKIEFLRQVNEVSFFYQQSFGVHPYKKNVC